MNKKSFTYHNGGKVFLYVLFAVSLIETPVVHFLLTIWLGSTVAWIVTILTILGIIYMIADFFAMKNRPIIVDDEMLYFRLGKRVSIDIPLSNIQNVSHKTYGLSDSEELKKEQIINLAPSIESTTLIELKEPIIIKSLLGKQTQTKKIAIYLDEPNKFILPYVNDKNFERVYNAMKKGYLCKSH